MKEIKVLCEVEPHWSEKSKRNITRVRVECFCGRIFETRKNNVVTGGTRSCGCLYKEAKITHGLAKHPLHVVWANIKQRCNNPKNSSYRNYGARGITICDEWSNNFASFYDWAIYIHWDKTKQIDRIISDKGYEPGNCRIVTISENNRNKRTNKMIEYNNETRCLTEWCELLGLNYKKVEARFRYGWSVNRAFS